MITPIFAALLVFLYIFRCGLLLDAGARVSDWVMVATQILSDACVSTAIAPSMPPLACC